jgi:hypothetical protein
MQQKTTFKANQTRTCQISAFTQNLTENKRFGLLLKVFSS